MNHSEFERKLSDEATALRIENAPSGLSTCPNCLNREPDPSSGAPGSDYWRCTATMLLPVFACFSEPRRAPINLKLFDPAANYASRFNSMTCPLFAPRHQPEETVS